MTYLDVDIIRAMAYDEGWQEIQFNKKSRVIGFARGVERINVYYTTGTVGTCTDHPRLGKTQLFRRNVDYDQLDRLFMDVREHTGKGYYRKISSGVLDPEAYMGARKSVNWWCTTDNGMEDLVTNNSPYSPEDYPILVLGETWLGVDKNGRPAWAPGIPKLLDNKLRGRQPWLPTVDVVCLGPDDDTYFVQFADGKAEWVGLPEDLSDEIKSRGSRVRILALGPHRSFYCKFEDGYSMWAGLPRELHNKINGRQKSLPPVSQLNLDPSNGENYFVQFENGKWQTQASFRCIQVIKKIKRKEWKIYDIQFGHDSSWLIRYSK